MNPTIHVHDAGGERSFRTEDLPLEIGGGGAAIRLAGDGEAVLARLGVDDGTPFIVPAAAEPVVNGRPCGKSCWLRDGDLVTFDGGHLVIHVRAGRLDVHARSRSAADEPPRTAEATAAGHAVIQPVAFHPERGRGEVSRRGSRIVKGAIAAVFALLALAAWFLFTARSIDIVIDPQPQSVAIEGGLFKVRVGGRYLLRPGDYRVAAELEGYESLEAAIEVGRSGNQQFILEMRKLPGRLSISSGALEGAEVLIDGQAIGETPLRDADVPAGLHRLVVRARNHLPHEEEIEVEGMHRQQSFTVRLQPNWAPVTVDSEPSGATVSLDGETLGRTPLTAEIEAGDRELVFSLTAHETQTRPVTVVAGEGLVLDTVRLPVADGTLAVSTEPPGASVSIDGQFAGRTPLEIPVEPNEPHRVSLSRPGYESATRRVELKPEETQGLAVRLEPIIGTVRVIVSPSDAEVRVDGRRVAEGEQLLSLTAAPHRIEVRKSGYAPYVETVTPRRGLEQRLTVVLQTIAEAAAADLPATLETAGGRLHLISGGSLRMGSVRREQGRRSNEVRRDVELTREFYIGETEVSNAAFRQFMPDHSSGFMAGISLDGDDQPVVRVSWQLAARYCNWLSEQEGLPTAYEDRDGRLVARRPMNIGYRLPSEAEWAWVARFAGGPQPRRYPWGDELPPPDGAGNFADNAAASVVARHLDNYDDSFTVTAPVDSFAPNRLGLRSLGGNVSEWTHDYYELSPADPFLSQVDPLGPQFGDRHVIRGGSWMTGSVSELRSAYRDAGAQGRPDLGFRVGRYAR